MSEEGGQDVGIPKKIADRGSMVLWAGSKVTARLATDQGRLSH